MGCYSKRSTFPKVENNGSSSLTSSYSLKGPNVIKVTCIYQDFCSIYFSQIKHPKISEISFVSFNVFSVVVSFYYQNKENIMDKIKTVVRYKSI